MPLELQLQKLAANGVPNNQTTELEQRWPVHVARIDSIILISLLAKTSTTLDQSSLMGSASVRLDQLHLSLDSHRMAELVSISRTSEVCSLSWAKLERSTILFRCPIRIRIRISPQIAKSHLGFPYGRYARGHIHGPKSITDCHCTAGAESFAPFFGHR